MMKSNSFIISSSVLDKKRFHKYLDFRSKNFNLYLNDDHRNCKKFSYKNFIYILIGYIENLPHDSLPNKIVKILHENFQNKSLHQVLGKFNLLILDSSHDNLFIYSSTKQSFDIFYFKNQTNFFVTNNIFNFKLLKEVPICRNLGLEHFFFTYDFFPFNETHVDDVKTLPHDCLLQFNNLYEINLIPENIKEKNNGIDLTLSNLHDLFISYFKKTLPVNRSQKIAVLMGGIDSMFVAKMIKDLGYQVECFTFQHEDTRLNQDNIDKFVQEAGIAHTWVPIKEKEYISELKQYYEYGLPSSFTPYFINTGIAAKVIKSKGYDFCYTGDGCDEIFYGYPTVYKRIRLILALKKYLPISLRRSVLFILEKNPLYSYFRSLTSVPIRTLKTSLMNDRLSNFLAYNVLTEMELRKIFPMRKPVISNVDILNRVAPQFKFPIMQGYAGRSASSTNKKRNQYIYLKYGLLTLSPFHNKKIIKFAKNIGYKANINKNHSLGKNYFLQYIFIRKILTKLLIFQKKNTPVPSLSDSYIINNISALALKSNDLRFKEIIRLIRNDHSMTISNKLYKTNNNLSFFNILYSYFKFHTTKK